MRRVAWVVFALAVAGTAAFAQTLFQVPPESPRVVYLRGSGLPETVVIKPTVPPTARVCAEPTDGAVACRTVAEFRAWVAQR